MTEHVCDFSWLSGYSKEQKAHISGIMCICGRQLSIEDAMRRVNATERLSAKRARTASSYAKSAMMPKMDRENNPIAGKVYDALRAYADTLEGKR